ncbi:MAG TPA: hypothetical protein VMW42_08530 [Desulfatiglandales bacterium]|nr:hypothetical protein [Desulfatiglandales bacterium]
MERKKMTAEERQHYENRLLSELTRHIGAARKIGMGELYEKVFDKTWKHKINDTKPLRTLVVGLKKRGIPILSSRSNTNGGYWLPSAGSETTEYCRKVRIEALRKLKQIAIIRNTTVDIVVNQMALDLRPPTDQEEAA